MKASLFPKVLLFLFTLTCLMIHPASAQKCYPTVIVDNSQGTTTNIRYDGQHNMTSVTLKTAEGQLTYSVSMEKTANGYKKIFTATKVDPAVAAYTLSKKVLTYDKDNRLLLVEGTAGSMHATETFVYNATGQLIKIDQETIYKDHNGKETTAREQLVYIYPNASSKNPSEIKKYGNFNNNQKLELAERDIFTFDNHKSISDEFPFSSGLFRTYAANNVITASITYLPSNISVKQSYTYTFNAGGYPISKTYKFSEVNTTDTYAYDCK